MAKSGPGRPRGTIFGKPAGDDWQTGRLADDSAAVVTESKFAQVDVESTLLSANPNVDEWELLARSRDIEEFAIDMATVRIYT